MSLCTMGSKQLSREPVLSVGTEPSVSNHRLPWKQTGRTEPALALTLLFGLVKQVDSGGAKMNWKQEANGVNLWLSFLEQWF